MTTISFNTQVNSDTNSVTAPAGIIAGDLLIFQSWAWQGSDVTPTGFTNIKTLEHSNRYSIISYKIADGSEASATITGPSGGTQESSRLAVFRGNAAVTSVTVQDLEFEGTGGDPAAQTVSVSAGTVPLVALGSFGHQNASGTASWDGTALLTETSYIDFGYSTYNSGDTPSDLTADLNDSGNSNHIISCYLELT